MVTQVEYFAENRTKNKYHLGDRIRGLWNNIPFSGTVAVDHVVYEAIGPEVSIFLDLPIKHNNCIYNIITVKYENIIDMKGSYGVKSKTNSKKSILDRH